MLVLLTLLNGLRLELESIPSKCVLHSPPPMVKFDLPIHWHILQLLLGSYRELLFQILCILVLDVPFSYFIFLFLYGDFIFISINAYFTPWTES